MNYWLIKSEPTAFSIEQLAKEKNQTTCWDGVRNYQARNFLRDDMKRGDLAFFYHSNCSPPGIVGIVEVVREGYPDDTAFDKASDHYDPRSSKENPQWYMVDVRLKETFPRMVTLEELKSIPSLNTMKILQRGNRLSVTPVTPSEWKEVLKQLG